MPESGESKITFLRENATGRTGKINASMNKPDQNRRLKSSFESYIYQ